VIEMLTKVTNKKIATATKNEDETIDLDNSKTSYVRPACSLKKKIF